MSKAQRDAIICLRLEAQENLLKKRELEASGEKQNIRHITAIERREDEIRDEMRNLLGKLNEDALLVLLVAYPFPTIH